MAYPSRPRPDPLPRFLGSARPGHYAEEDVKRFVLDRYAQGASLREIAELTDRSFSAVRNILQRAGVSRRGSGATPIGLPR